MTKPFRKSGGARKGEQVGGGFFVFRRDKKTGRIAGGKTLPFEHPSLESARAEAERLHGLTGEAYAVLQQWMLVAAAQPAGGGDDTAQ